MNMKSLNVFNPACAGCVASMALAGTLLLSGCASTYQQRSVKGSGFLRDYSQLKDRGGDTAMLSYVDPKADFRAYNKIMLDPVCAYAAGKDSSMAKLSKEQQLLLLNYFDATLRNHLKKDYALVSQPGPGVLRVRVALTEATGSKVVLDTVSTVLPIGLALSSVKALATGEHLNVGTIGAECEGLDSLTNKRLFAAVDARVGRKITLKFDKFSRWHAVEDACDFWAEQLHDRLIEKRGKAPSAR
ncbi:MAG: DUF3313 domain-containing protein [bacterium]